MWPLIEWCLEYCRRKLTADGVVASDTDELEGRFPTGEANLCTSTLYYDALLSAVPLGRELGVMPAVTARYAAEAGALAKAIDAHFGGEVGGYDTYRYYDGNTLLRSWICMPLIVGLRERCEGTVRALLSPELLTDDGLLTEQGGATFWDRSTLYALRGIYNAGYADRATEMLHRYSQRRLLGDHVPYPIEAWPEGSQRHLSAESGLYCRIVTEGLFGIRPAGLRSFDLTPGMPSAWERMSLRRIRAFDADFDISVGREVGGKLRITVMQAGKKPKILSRSTRRDNPGETNRLIPEFRMNFFRSFVFSLVLSLAYACTSGHGTDFRVISPDGTLAVDVRTGDSLTYAVTRHGASVLLPSAIALQFDDGTAPGRVARVSDVHRSAVEREIEAPFHRQARFTEHYNQLRLDFEGGYSVTFRVFDEGCAYRFETALTGGRTVADEVAEFNFAGDPELFVAYSDGLCNAYQSQYVKCRLSELGTEKPVLLPLAADCGPAGRVLVCESDLESYPGMFLMPSSGGLRGLFAQVPDSCYLHERRCQEKVATRHGYIACVQGARTYPWRILAVADEDRELPDQQPRLCPRSRKPHRRLLVGEARQGRLGVVE